MTDSPFLRPAKSMALGRAVLVVTVVFLVASVAASVINGMDAVAIGDGSFTYAPDLDSSDPAEAAHARSVLEHMQIGLFLFVPTIILAVMAVVSNRGRRSGVVAIAILVLLPVISITTFLVVWISGLSQ